MKLTYLALMTILVAAQPSFAQTTPATLKANMDTIKSLVAPLLKNVNDSSQNQTSASQAAQLITVFGAVLSQAPSMIATMPADQQAAALATYKSMIQKEIDDSTALQKALLANDNATASSVLQDMISLKLQGHHLFTN